ncbi:MAG: DUF4258 domain-containing protein [Candidatus Zixiibacteriota bacterium]
MRLEIVFSRHARRQMRWRDISEQEVKQTRSDYDRIEDSVRTRKNALKKIGKRLIKVTFREEDDKILVITALVRK